MALSRLKKLYPEYLFAIAGIILLVRLSLILYHFSFQVTDNDQALFWIGCHDFSKGIFHTPFIYGCNYGNMLECLLAVPFYLAGVPVYYALPLSNCVWLCILVFMLGKQLDRQLPGRHAGFLLLVFLTFVPVEYYALAFAAKGHIAGIFMALIALNIVAYKRSNISLSIAGLILGLAIQFNPNGLFIVIISALFIEKFRQFIPLATGTAVALLYQLVITSYQVKTDTGFIHGQWNIVFTVNDWIRSFEDIDMYLNMVTPVFSKMGFLTLVIPLVCLVISLKKKEWIKALVAAGYFMLLLMSFGVNKVTDGTIDVLFSYSRFYIAVGLCNALLLALIISSAGQGRIMKGILYCTPLVMIIILFTTARPARELADNAGGWTMSVKKTYIKDLLEHKDTLLSYLRSEKRDKTVILVCDYFYYTELLYIATLDVENVVIRYHCNKKFYWKPREIDAGKPYDILICPGFDKLLETRAAEYPGNFNPKKNLPYFMFRDVRNADGFITSFVGE